MFKHMFINANIMILLNIFQNHADFDLGVPDLRVQQWTQSRHLPHTKQFDFWSFILQDTEIDHIIYFISSDV